MAKVCTCSHNEGIKRRIIDDLLVKVYQMLLNSYPTADKQHAETKASYVSGTKAAYAPKSKDNTRTSNIYDSNNVKPIIIKDINI